MVALSDLARQTAALLKIPETSYVADLWKDGLPRSLLWHKITWHTTREQLEGALSWSWLSVNKKIYSVGCYNFDDERCIDIRDVDMGGQDRLFEILSKAKFLQTDHFYICCGRPKPIK